MKVAVTALLALVLAAPEAYAAEPCPAALSTNNPAFGAPRPCTATPPPKTDPAKPAKVTSENGKTVYTYGANGDTTIAVGGSVRVDTVVGKGTPRP